MASDVTRARSHIFISYRREESDIWVGRLADELRRHFPSEQIFQDVASIDPGVPFKEVLNSALSDAAAMLVVIGPRWLTATDKQGRRRLEQSTDWVRQEVAESLRRQGMRVFPLLVGGAEMPSEEDLPDSLKPLAERQAFELTVRHWTHDVAQLIEILKRAGSAEHRSPDEENARQRAEQDEARRDTEEHAAKEQARRKAEEEDAKKAAEEKARRKADAETRRKSDEEARRESEERAAKEQARRKAEQDAKKAAEEEARRKAEAEAEARRRTQEDVQSVAEFGRPHQLYQIGEWRHYRRGSRCCFWYGDGQLALEVDVNTGVGLWQLWENGKEYTVIGGYKKADRRFKFQDRFWESTSGEPPAVVGQDARFEMTGFTEKGRLSVSVSSEAITITDNTGLGSQIDLARDEARIHFRSFLLKDGVSFGPGRGRSVGTQ